MKLSLKGRVSTNKRTKWRSAHQGVWDARRHLAAGEKCTAFAYPGRLIRPRQPPMPELRSRRALLYTTTPTLHVAWSKGAPREFSSSSAPRCIKRWHAWKKLSRHLQGFMERSSDEPLRVGDSSLLYNTFIVRQLPRAWDVIYELKELLYIVPFRFCAENEEHSMTNVYSKPLFLIFWIVCHWGFGQDF